MTRRGNKAQTNAAPRAKRHGRQLHNRNGRRAARKYRIRLGEFIENREHLNFHLHLFRHRLDNKIRLANRLLDVASSAEPRASLRASIRPVSNPRSSSLQPALGNILKDGPVTTKQTGQCNLATHVASSDHSNRLDVANHNQKL